MIKRENESLLKILFSYLFFFVIPIEEFNAFTGLIFGYGFTMLIWGQLVEKVFNFSPGPSKLPQVVINKVEKALKKIIKILENQF